MSPSAQPQTEARGGQTPNTAEATAEALDAEPLDEASEAAISELATSIKPDTQAKIIDRFTRDFDLDVYSLGDVAIGLGITLPEATNRVGDVILAFQVQADMAVKAEGVDPYELWAWAKDHAIGLLRQAVRQQAMERSTEGYRQLARTFRNGKR